jgi:hypothetical protein
VARLLEGVSFEILLALKVEESPICLMGARRPTESTVEKIKLIFSLKILTIIKHLDVFQLKDSELNNNYEKKTD